MILQTARLRLDDLEPHHAELSFAGLRDEQLYEFCEDEPPESVTSLAARIMRDLQHAVRRTDRRPG